MKERKLSEYRVLEYFVKHIDLEIDLTKDPVQSKSLLTIEPNKESPTHGTKLTLDGENMTLHDILLNNKKLTADQYELSADSLTIKEIPQNQPFKLSITTTLGENSDLFGLYKSGDIVLVKAETEGMRRVLYLNDRPDNLQTFKTTIIADQKKYPVLLSNGKIIKRAELPDGLHSITWSDEVPKPSYLFALVAGELEYSSASFESKSGRVVPIVFYVPQQDTYKCAFAKQVLQLVMAWDEKTNNLECKLPQHIVTGVPKYASGASEPTGLNIFNTQNLFATAASKTDNDFLRVLLVIAHEYLHLYSGDYITIRDWFNLTVKEGLTDFRTDQFRESLFGDDIVRLMDGKVLDEGAPRKHSYTAVRSLYTTAAYEKGAHIFRMMMLMVGKEAFNKALTKYFIDNEGKAVTLEILLDSLSKTTSYDFNTFLPWFDETGVPELKFTDKYDAGKKKYTLTVETVDDKARPIPCVIGLVAVDGEELLSNTTLTINQPKMVFTFNNITSRPVPSLLRSFSAPVKVDYNYKNEDLLTLVRHDTNVFNRCDAAKTLITKIISDHCAFNTDINAALTAEFFNTFKSLFKNKSLTDWLLAELLTIPSEETLIATLPKPNFEKIAAAHQLIRKSLAIGLKDELHERFNALQYYKPPRNPLFAAFNFRDSGVRRFKALCFSYFQLTDTNSLENDMRDLFKESLGKNMSETISSLHALIEMKSPKAELSLSEFFVKWKDDPNAINYWFKIQASTHDNSVIPRVEGVMANTAFDIQSPNNVYALLIPFIANPYGFHDKSGRGYKLITEAILKLDIINPPVAAKLTERFNDWDRFDSPRKELMVENLTFIGRKAKSDDVKNAAKKGLDKVVKEPPIPIEITFLAQSKQDKVHAVLPHSSVAENKM